MGWLANCLNVIGLVLLGQQCRAGWLFGIAAEGLWIVRAYQAGGMEDLMTISALYCCIAARNYWIWGRDASQKASRSL